MTEFTHYSAGAIQQAAEQRKFRQIWEGHQYILDKAKLSEDDMDAMKRMSARQLFAFITILRLNMTKSEQERMEIDLLLERLDLGDLPDIEGLSMSDGRDKAGATST